MYKLETDGSLDRNSSTPLSSLMLSSQVFHPFFSSAYSSRSGAGNIDRAFPQPQHRVPLTLSVRRRSVSGPLDDEDQTKALYSNNEKIRHYEYSANINKLMKVAAKADNLSELGSHGVVSEGNFNPMYWYPVAFPDNQVAGKLVFPNFLNMKASTRAAQDGIRLQTGLPQTIILNSQTNSNNLVSELFETGRYDYLKSSPARLYNLQREKCISVTYKEQMQRPDKLTSAAALNRAVHSESANGVAGDVESRLRLNDVSGECLSNKTTKKKGEESREDVAGMIKSNSLQRNGLASAADEGSEEFVSRAGSPDDDASARDGDSQAWDDEDEAVEDEEDVSDGDDILLEADDDDYEVGEVSGSRVGDNSSVATAPPELALRNSVELPGASTSKKQLSLAPLSRVRIAQQEQQKRLRDNIGIDKNRPATGCSVVFNGTQPTPSPPRNRLAALPKRCVTRPPPTNGGNANGGYRPGAGELAPFQRRTTNKVGFVSSDSKVLQALQPSMFSNLPPTIVFGGEDYTVTPLPRELKNLLRWRTSTITPNVMKKILARSNFKLTSKDDVWVGCWAKHMKQDLFKAVREFQKFNHFPGSFQVGRKDRLWRNLSAMQARYGRREFSFFPQTYVLPGDYKLLKRVMEESEKRQRWILKPPASARGNGIRCVCSIKQVPKKRPVIVQRYIHQPYLINESKFDIRLYVYVTCFDPLKAYIFNDGLARFASSKYSSSLRDLPNKFMHLTNYSVNKHNSEYQSNNDQDACTGHKWSLHALWNHLSSPPSEGDPNTPRKQVDVGQLWAQIKDIAVKTLIAAEQHVVSAVKMNVANRYAVHELFGFDILLDRDLRPWLLEVNISPSLHSDSPLDCKVKGEMLKDLLNLAGYRLPDPNSLREGDASAVAASENNHGSLLNQSSQPSRTSIHFDPRLVASNLSVDERSKHSFYTQNTRNEVAMKSLLDTTTPDDLRILAEFEDERSRMGNFEPLFPTTQTHSYLKMLEPPRYYNLLLDAWLRTYGDEVDSDGFPINRHERGLELLEALCRRGLHLENPTNDWRHIWRPPPMGTSHSLRPNASSANSNTGPSPTKNINNAATAYSSPSPSYGPFSSNNSNINSHGRVSTAAMHSHSAGSLPNYNNNS